MNLRGVGTLMQLPDKRFERSRVSSSLSQGKSRYPASLNVIARDLMRSTVALFASLSLSTIVSADAKIDFETATARWRSQVITAYSFTYQDQDGGVISAFCGGALIRVSVGSGKSAQTRVIQDTRHCPTGTRGKAIDVEVPSSIDALFDRIHRWIYDPPTNVDLEFTYDPKYGFPTRWSATKLENADSDEGFAITDFKVNK